MTEANDELEKETVEAVIVPDRRAANPYRKPFLILVVAICLSLIADSVSSFFIWDVAHGTNKIVKDVDFRNSAKNREAQQDALEQIILRVDCNSRKAIEEALNDISDENPGISFDIDITSLRCGSTPAVETQE